MKGRKPTPTAVLKARGSWVANTRGAEPQDPVELPPCPEELTGEARKEWLRLAPLLLARGTASKASALVLAGLCRWWAVYLQAMAKVEELHAAGADPLPVRRWQSMAAEAWQRYLDGAREFGLGPASRGRVKAGDNGQGEGNYLDAYRRA